MRLALDKFYTFLDRPLFGWSRSSGDLRVAHFFALHAQQALPLAGAAIVALRLPRPAAVLWLCAAGYLALIAGTFVQAIMAQPFLG